jgi:hypothetical protein
MKYFLNERILDQVRVGESGRSQKTHAPELEELDPPDLPEVAGEDVDVLLEDDPEDEPDCALPEAAAPEEEPDPALAPAAAAAGALGALSPPWLAESPVLAPATASAPEVGTAASLVLLVPPLLLRKSVTYQPEPLS